MGICTPCLSHLQKFAHIAGIVVLHQRGDLRIGEVRLVVLEPPAVGDVADVLPVFAQGRNPDLHDVEPLVEVFAKLALLAKRRGTRRLVSSHRDRYRNRYRDRSIVPFFVCLVWFVVKQMAAVLTA